MSQNISPASKLMFDVVVSKDILHQERYTFLLQPIKAIMFKRTWQAKNLEEAVPRQRDSINGHSI